MVPLSDRERATLRGLIDTILPSLPTVTPSELARRSGTDAGIDADLERVVFEILPERQRRGFLRFLRTIDSGGLNLVLSATARGFRQLSPAERELFLLGWAHSRLGLKRQGFEAIKRLALVLFYGGAGPLDATPLHQEIGYLPNAPPRQPEDEARWRPVPSPWRPQQEVETSVDVAVVGSGAGGAVIAATLAERGHRVLVLEGGPWRAPGSFPRREFEGFQTLLQGRGVVTTRDLAIVILAGALAGGSTVINWMTCLDPPAEVRREWEAVHGLGGVAGGPFDAHLAAVRERLSVGDSESTVNPSNEVLRRGSERLGYVPGRDFEVIHRNAVGCRNRCDLCGFGCEYNSKRSALVTFLTDAMNAGAPVLCDTRVDRIEIVGGRARGLSGTYRGPGGPHRVHVSATHVVLAGGALSTPLLLARSGVTSPALGRNVHLHPTSAIVGEFAEPIRVWAGPMQTIAVRKFQSSDEGLHGPWIEAAPAHLGLAALALPWAGGARHKEEMRRISHAATSIALVRDWADGTIRPDPDGAPRIDYTLTRRDRENIVRGLVETARIHHAAGAVRLRSLHSDPVEAGNGSGPIPRAELEAFLEALRRRGIRENAVGLFSAHPTGGAVLGIDPRRSVAGPTGQVHDVPGLWIGDGSALPSAPAVNPMLTIMAMARRTAGGIDAALRRVP